MKISALTVVGTFSVIVALAVLTSHRPSWGKNGGSEPRLLPEKRPEDGFATRQPLATARPAARRPAASRQNEFRSEVSSLVRQLRQAEGQEEQEKIMNGLRELFAHYFDTDLEARQKQVDELKDRIADLEAQIEKRREAKDEIIDLQLKVIRNEAEGLGFYSELSLDGAVETFLSPPSTDVVEPAGAGVPSPGGPRAFNPGEPVHNETPRDATLRR